MTNNLQKLFSILCMINIIQNTGSNNTNITTSMIRQKLNNYLSSKNQVNHIDRKQITGGIEVLRREKNHKLVLKELVQQNSYQIIAEDKSVFLHDALKYSSAYEKIKDFAQEMVKVMQADLEYQLNQILEETLTKLLTLVNLNFIGQRQEQFFYLYDFNSFRSFLHDLKDKKIRFENQCNQQENQSLVQCQFSLSTCYEVLYEHFAQFQLAQVTSPEFKDKYEELIDSQYFENLDMDQISQISKMYIKNIEQGANGTMQKLKTLVQDLVSRRNNVLSKFYESLPSKQKVYENIINFLNRSVVIKNSKDYFLNFYAYHFILSLEKVLGNAYIAQENEQKIDIRIPYKSFVYEKAKVETFLKDAKALDDYLKLSEDKKFDQFKQNIDFLINYFSELDDQQSSQYVLEQIKSFKKQTTMINPKLNSMISQKSNMLQTKSTLKYIKPMFQQNMKSQQLQENQKEQIRNDIMNYHLQVPKSELVQQFVNFRKIYEINNFHKQRTCERSFYEFLQAAGSMFLGSSTLNYQGEEMQIYGYIYRKDFQDKLIKKILELQDCIDQKQNNNLQFIKQSLEQISDDVNKLYRLNHDFIELKIEYKLDAIKKKLNILKNDLNQYEQDQIKKFEQDIKNDFMKQKNIQEYQEIQYEKTGQKNSIQPLSQPIMEDVQTIEEQTSNNRKQNQLEENLNQNLQNQTFMNDIDDTNTYERPEMIINKLKDSQLYVYFEKIDQQDQKNQYINQFKSYQKNIHFLINQINELNESIQKNQFGEGKKGIWLSFKIPSQKLIELKNQLQKMNEGTAKIYSQESDEMFSIISQLQTFIKQNLHSTRGYFYDRVFIPNDQSEDNQGYLNIKEINLENIKGSQLHPIILSTSYNLNKILQNNDQIQNVLQSSIDDFKQLFNDLINDDNLQIVQKQNKRLNAKLNYGKYKFSSQKVKNFNNKLDQILDQLSNFNDEDVQNLKDDINSIKNFFNNQKRTRAYIYESTKARFDDNRNFINFEEDESTEQENNSLSNEQRLQKYVQGEILKEESNEESVQEFNPKIKLMNIEKIQFSKIYQPLKSIQGQKLQNEEEVNLYNHMASEFNEMMENEDLITTTIRKIKKQKVKIGTYHFKSDKANSFLSYVRELQILIEEENQNENLKQDLNLIVNLFNTFLSTRKNYHEAFSATLVDDQGKEISKPLYNADFDKLSQTSFSMISDIGLDLQSALNQSKLDSDEEQSRQESSQENLKDKDSQEQIQKINKPQKRVKRRIYVMDIVTCEDCIKDGYVEIIKN